MKILKSWMEDYIDLGLSDQEVAEKLSLAGIEVEEFSGNIDPLVIVAEIRKVEKHPNADKLQLATIFDGIIEKTIVCGAPNIKAGQKVPFAQIGSKLPAGEISKAKIRGIESEGMLCAEDELGLGDNHAGIKILPDEWELGKSVCSYLQNDAVYNIEITPNRGDCLSHIGVARELAALLKLRVAKKPVSFDSSAGVVSDFIKVEVTNTEGCPQYKARVVKGVKVAESPDWLKARLSACGIRSINNVVDVTNYILLDLGQPMHAFDLTKIDGGQIIVRDATEGETFSGLDNKEYGLSNKNLVIADRNKAIAIAGVIGGANSQVTSKTADIVLESAEFMPQSVRKTAKGLSISTEASYRFERGIDSGGLEYALNKAAKMIAEIAGGKVASGIVSVGGSSAKVEVKIEDEKIRGLLNLTLKDEEIRNILKRLGFETAGDTVFVPSWRHDVERWQDLAEEIGRIHGYHNILPLLLPEEAAPKKSDYYKIEFVKDILSNAGLTENISYTFLSEADISAAQLKPQNLLEVANPIQAENKYLRNSLIPGQLKAIAKNPAFDSVAFYEIGRVFTKNDESTFLALAVSGKDSAKIIKEAVSAVEDSFKMKSIFEIKEIERDLLKRFKIKKPVVYTAEVNLDAMLVKAKMPDQELNLNLKARQVHYRPVSKFPSITRDLAFIIDKSVEPDRIIEMIASLSDLISRVELFDEFVSPKFGAGKKNVAFHLSLERLDRTMTDEEADIVLKNVIDKVEKEFKAKLR